MSIIELFKNLFSVKKETKKIIRFKNHSGILAPVLISIIK